MPVKLGSADHLILRSRIEVWMVRSNALAVADRSGRSGKLLDLERRLLETRI